MDNVTIKTESEELNKEYAEKCDVFESALNEEQQKQFYNLENLMSKLNTSQRKDLINLMTMFEKIYSVQAN